MLKRRALRFGATGVFVTLVHVVVASGWIHFVDGNPSFANAVAFTVATLVSFLMNTLWSFSSVIEKDVLLKFALVALVGLLLSASISGVVDWLGFDYKIGIFAVVCVLPPSNFLMHHFWTYRAKSTSVDAVSN